MITLLLAVLRALSALIALTALTPTTSPVAASTKAQPPPTAATGLSGLIPTTGEVALRDALNAERVVAGLAPLAVDGELVAVARARSRDMLTGGDFAHFPAGRPSAYQLLTARGVRYAAAGEVLARVQDRQDSGRRAVIAFMQSDSHRERILDPRYQLIGVGALTSRSGLTIYTVILLRPVAEALR